MALFRTFSLCSLFSIAACAPEPESRPTWNGEVGDLIADRCGGCHYAGGIGGFSLESYDDVVLVKGAVLDAVESGRMPPWFASDDCTDFSNDPSLSPEEIASLAAWVEGGAPLGEEEEEDFSLPEVAFDYDIEVGMGTPFMPHAERDEYRCFLLDPGLTEDTFVSAFEVIPGATAQVHHVVTYMVPEEDVAMHRAPLVEEDGRPGYSCPVGPAGDSIHYEWLGGWAPGRKAEQNRGFPAGSGVAMRAGDHLLMQVHYSALNSSDNLADQTRLQLRLAEDVERTGEVQPFTDVRWVLGANEMLIPAGESEVTHTFAFTSRSEFSIHNTNMHMHLLGTGGSFRLDRADGSTECLVALDDWDFGWQLTYRLEEPVAVHEGDTLTLECEWDNSAENQPVVDGEQWEPVDVGWGEETQDEMCLVTAYLSKER